MASSQNINPEFPTTKSNQDDIKGSSGSVSKR